jgi:uncharacterized membrane protein (DUF485 family)
MDSGWFYLERGSRRGPVDLSSLVKVLLASSQPRRMKIWREGLADWQDAGLVPEVLAKLPPPVVTANESQTASTTVTKAETVARLYSRLVALVGAQYVLPPLFLAFAAPWVEDESVLAGAVVLLVAFLFGVFGWIVTTSYSLMRAVESKSAVLRTLGMFVPLVNLLVLFGISSETNSWCKQHGIKVGFFGHAGPVEFGGAGNGDLIGPVERDGLTPRDGAGGADLE